MQINKTRSSTVEIVKWASVLAFCIFIVILGIIFRQQLSHFSTFGLLGIFLTNLFASAVPFIPVPGIVTVVAGGMIYTPFFVALTATLGAVIGDTFSFFIGLSGKKLLLQDNYVFYEKLVKHMRKYGGLVIVLFAFVPNPIFDAVGVVAGLLNYPITKFIFWLFVGRLMRNLILAFFGAGFQEAIDVAVILNALRASR